MDFAPGTRGYLAGVVALAALSAAAFSAAAFCSGVCGDAKALPAMEPTMAPTATAPMVPIMPEPAATGAAGAAGAAAGVGALAVGALGATGALAGAAALGLPLNPPPRRLACAKEGKVSEAMAKTAMDRWVRLITCMRWVPFKNSNKKGRRCGCVRPATAVAFEHTRSEQAD